MVSVVFSKKNLKNEESLALLETCFYRINRQAELKEQVQTRQETDVVLETIRSEFDIAISTVSEWCKDIKSAVDLDKEID